MNFLSLKKNTYTFVMFLWVYVTDIPVFFSIEIVNTYIVTKKIEKLQVYLHFILFCHFKRQNYRYTCKVKNNY